MCEKCRELDAKIVHYQQLSKRLTDRPALEGIGNLIAKFQAAKKALHPEGQ